MNPSHLEPVTNEENARRSPFNNLLHCPRGHLYTVVDKQEGARRIRHKYCRVCRGVGQWPRRVSTDTRRART